MFASSFTRKQKLNVMKTIKLLFTATAVAIVAIATAVENPKMNVIPVTADRAIVSITNENAALFELSIHAENGDLVYYKQSAKPITDYQKTFDFENLENGNYVMNLKINDTKLSRNFAMHNSGISVGESKLRVDPFFTFDGKTLKFSYLNFDQENFRFNLYNKQELVYQTKVGKDFNLTSGFDLSKLDSGAYTVILSSYNNEYVYNLEK